MGADRGKQLWGRVKAAWKWFGSGEAPVETAKTVAAFLAGAFDARGERPGGAQPERRDVERAVVNHPR